MNSTNPWYYNGKPVLSLEDVPEGAIGFTYLITRNSFLWQEKGRSIVVNEKLYIGRKILFTRRKTRISKKEKAETKTRKTFKQVIKESDWKEYWSSSADLKKDLALYGTQYFRREIIRFCYTTKELSYRETAAQFEYQVLERDTYNLNILGRYFCKDIKPKQDE